ncbi:selenocysteine synthase [Pseudonocardia sp. EC080610-09]|uniref:L-seryl-tRNA(Sec) selenium transferase n=1 Tax=unclassified Pseudonocardia TaxID=2619320 RepID=UPI0006CB1F69|nr:MULTISPECIES: L-seryl-tRNA(Sec) selenium transferase [unclassified Pseudonocardia]ALE74685.1 selenocysteine synthase [Pseudonocardia sp. EC080625-04]ALL78115.1 selenocysteine synthase [Pseudonocardia sp. EC080610-09]ALL81026.1 selenocysteine synthase [Pseudonocardia sp. EC080619-01]
MTTARHAAADPRRRIPRTDAVLAAPELAGAIDRLGRARVKRAVAAAQQRARDGEIDPSDVTTDVLAALPAAATAIRPVLNASGVLLHTNLGRAPLSGAAVAALGAAAGTCDVELDLATGRRGTRGAGAVAALRDAVPGAGAAWVANNGAAALALVCAALAGTGREIVVSRGQLVEIGDGFRIPELIESTGARLRPVGTTNRTHLRDYADAIGPDTAFVLVVHPSNFVVSGFVSTVGIGELAGLGPPVVADIGSGLLTPHPLLPDEPDAAGTLADGADLVTASGDKLLGGPQAGLLLGGGERGTALVETVRRFPLARAMRVDKLTLAALEASVAGPPTPVREFLDADPAALRGRADALAAALAADGVDATAVDTVAGVGGGGAPGVELASAGIALPARYAAALRAGDPPVLGRVADDRCLLDLRALPPAADAVLARAVREVR